MSKAKSYWNFLEEAKKNNTFVIIDNKKEDIKREYFELGVKSSFNAIKRELGKLFCEYEEKGKNILLKDIIKDIDNILCLLEK